MRLQQLLKFAIMAITGAFILVILITNIIIVGKLPIFNRPEATSPLPLGASVDALKKTLIVLGAGVRRKELSGMLRCRMLKAIELYNAQKSDRILLSGDGTNPHYNETAAMRKFALQNAVNADAVLTDPLGFSTYDSLRRAIEVFGIQNATIVSQDFHLSRAVWLADSFGIHADGESCDQNGAGLYYHLREIPARSKDVFLRWLDVAPRSNRDELF